MSSPLVLYARHARAFKNNDYIVPQPSYTCFKELILERCAGIIVCATHSFALGNVSITFGIDIRDVQNYNPIEECSTSQTTGDVAASLNDFIRGEYAKCMLSDRSHGRDTHNNMIRARNLKKGKPCETKHMPRR
jgi:hypothetical protein